MSASHWLVPFGAVLAATVLKLVMGNWLSSDANASFLAAVGLVAWRVGSRPAVLAIALAAVAQTFFFLAPLHSFVIADTEHVIALGAWCIEAGFVVLVFKALEVAGARLREAHDELELQVRVRTESLRISEERYRTMFDANPLPMWVYDASTLGFLEVNEAAVRCYGYQRAELLQMTVKDIRPTEDVPSFVAAHTGARSAPFSGTRTHRRKDGTTFVVEGQAHALDFGGRAGRLVVVNDVTERLRADEGRKRAEARFARLAEAGVIGIVASNLDGRVLDVNDTVLAMVGYSRDEILTGKVQWRDLTPPEWKDVTARTVEELRTTGKSGLCRKALRRKDGTLVPVVIGSAMLDGANGECVSFVIDVSDRVRTEDALRSTEEQLRQAQKMEAVGRLAGGVAHDFNNILSVILSYGHMLLTDLASGDPARGDVDEIIKAGNRAAALTRQLLMFSRQQVIEPRVLDVNALLANTQKMLHRLVGEDVNLTVVTPQDIGHVLADAGSLEQVVMNLVVNARDAMPQGGQLTIETANVMLDEAYARDHVGVSPGPHTMLAVTDTGSGMDKTTLARIFEPFFTTKEMGKGTGLGLSTVFGIVQQAGGSVWVYSEVGKGTTFKIYLPTVNAPVDGARASVPDGLRRGSETVLIVEDEEQVRVVARGILRRLGYHVIDASSPADALLLCEQGTHIDLLLSDVVMPQMSGPELARRLAVARPSMKVLCMSGYTDDAVVRHGVLGSEVPFLQKPITPMTLMGKVREVLDG